MSVESTYTRFVLSICMETCINIIFSDMLHIYFSFATPVDRCMKCSKVRWKNPYFKKQR